MRELNLWLHVIGFSIYLGSTVTILLAILPMVTTLEDPAGRRQLFAKAMRVYNPLSLAALGVSLMTGAFNLTDYKARLGPRFFEAIGSVLAWKLLVVFVLILVATGASFGIGHRTVREELAGEAVDAAELDRRLRRLPGMLWTAVACTALAIWLGLGMSW